MCSLLWCSEGSGKRKLPEILKVCYGKENNKNIVNTLFKVKIDFCKERYWPWTGLLTMTHFGLNFQFQTLLCGYFRSLSVQVPPCRPPLSLSGLVYGPFFVYTAVFGYKSTWTMLW